MFSYSTLKLHRVLASLTLGVVLLSGCDWTPERDITETVGGEITSVPLNQGDNAKDALFTSLDPSQTGVDFTNPIDTTHPMKYLYASSMACGGVAIGDVDGDGQPDLYLTSGPKPNRLFRQTKSLEFEDITETTGVDGGGAWSTGASIIDIDNDGDLDIYVCNYDSPNLLYVNQGDGSFREEAKSFGLDFVDAAHTPAFCDYDRDGHLDLYLMTNFFYDPRGLATDPITGMVEGKPSVMPGFEKYYGITKVRPGPTPGTVTISHDSVGQADRLVRNNGNNTFTDVSQAAGIQGVGKGNSATWWDFDEDGWPDIYVGNDFRDPDRLYRNNGDGTFTNVIEEMVPHTTWFSMGADFADLNGDGADDFVIADMSGTNHFKQKTGMGAMSDSAEFLKTAVPRQYMRNVVFVNSRGGRFMEGAHLTGLANSDWTWTVRTEDFDNDGQVDVFFTNGMARNLNVSDSAAAERALPGETEWDKHIRANTPELREQNLAFRNLGDLKFSDVSKEWGLDHVGMSYASAAADLDRDGDLDIIVANLEEPVSIYRNDSTEQHRVLLQFIGTESNRTGLGTRVELVTSEGVQVRQLIPARGYMASHEPMMHFGLGDEPTIRELTVYWPSGHVQTFTDLPADQLYTITEPAGKPTKDAAPRGDQPQMFAASETLADVRHQEVPFDDYVRQPLIPNQYSQLGPGMAWGDIDGDGDEDLWTGGAKGHPGQLHRNDGGGKFTTSTFEAQVEADELPDDETTYEDMSGIWLDADSDGDLDLYVVSGGVECEPGDRELRDRLYLNDGTGQFSRASADALPEVLDSGGSATAADFDRDGDLDLFVGGRIIPGQYPMSPKSRLLRNDGGQFTDQTQELAPALLDTGMVTGSVWSDVDADGWLDLLVAHEWGPVKLFRNQQGQLVDHTKEAGLADRLGWWNGIASADIDNDGDMDYVVTNFGLNTKYHASPAKPTMIYYGEFEDGRMSIVEAEYEEETLFPVRGKSCSTHAMPHLANKFTTYVDFALADLAEIYERECLDDAIRFDANTLESGVFLNDGKGHFTFQELPRIAQIAPAFGLTLTEVNGDGNVDLYLAHNFYGPQPETGHMAGGVGLLLLGRGDGSFQPVPPRESGIYVAGDAKSVTTADVNGDGRHEIVVAQNNDRLSVFQSNLGDDAAMARVRLRGNPGNLQAVGARVSVHFDDGSNTVAEVTAGEGYLSQSSSLMSFGLGPGRKIEKIDVRWPDGQTSSLANPDVSSLIEIAAP